MSFRPFALALLLLLAGPAHAQPLKPEPGAWFGLFVSGPVAGNVLAWFDLHARSSDDFATVAYLVRPGIGYRVRPDMAVWLGYAWTPVVKRGDVTLDEHRPWQQWTWDGPRFESGLKLSFRSRLEERVAQGQVGLRFRQFVRLQSPWLGGGPLLLATWDEVFVAFNDTAWGQKAGFDQNRFFAGVGLKVGAHTRVEAGYFNNWLNRDGPDPFRHVAMVNVFVGW